MQRSADQTLMFKVSTQNLKPVRSPWTLYNVIWTLVALVAFLGKHECAGCLIPRYLAVWRSSPCLHFSNDAWGRSQLISVAVFQTSNSFNSFNDWLQLLQRDYVFCLLILLQLGANCSGYLRHQFLWPQLSAVTRCNSYWLSFDWSWLYLVYFHFHVFHVFHVFHFRSPQFELFNFDVPGFGAKKPFWSTAIVANDRLAYCACF